LKKIQDSAEAAWTALEEAGKGVRVRDLVHASDGLALRHAAQIREIADALPQGLA
jgi:hypothetical protein